MNPTAGYFQIALIGETSWAALGPGCSLSGSFSREPMPVIDCPTFDIRPCNGEAVSAACRQCHPGPDRPVDVDSLANLLMALGAKLVFAASVEDIQAGIGPVPLDPSLERPSFSRANS